MQQTLTSQHFQKAVKLHKINDLNGKAVLGEPKAHTT
jgi:hypothetical protein